MNHDKRAQSVINYLSKNPGATKAQMTDALSVNDHNITQSIAALRKSNAISSEMGYKRITKYSLTDSGKKMATPDRVPTKSYRAHNLPL